MSNLNQKFVFALLAAAGRIERRLDRKISMTSGISFTEYRLLKALQLEHQGKATRVDLASTVDLTPSAITRALKPLEKTGYVTTEKSERDARQSLASLTDTASSVLENTDKLIQDEINLLSVPTEQQADLRTFLDTIKW